METLFIPSKGRAANCKFIQAINGQKVNCIVVVEKEDYEAYSELYKNVNYMILPESNQGISYVRNYIKKHATETGLSHYWMVDDDVSGIFKREGTKLIRIEFEGLQEIENRFKSFEETGICSLEYSQFAWSASKPLVKNSFCDVFVFINVENTKGIEYRKYLEGKEDRDFAMQIVDKDFKTYRSTEFAFSAPKNGSNKGGLKESFYDVGGREKVCSERMVETWGQDVCGINIKPDGRIDVKINWNNLGSARNQLSMF